MYKYLWYVYLWYVWFLTNFFDEIFLEVFDEFFIFWLLRALGSEYLRSCFLLKQPNLSLHIMYSLHAAFPSGKCKIKEGRSHVAIFSAEFHPEYSTIWVLSAPHEMLIYIWLYSSKNFAVIDLNFRRLHKYAPCGPSMTDCLETFGVYRGGFRQVSVRFLAI